jgi:hypothetical protein
MNNRRAPSVAGLISGTGQRKVAALLRVDDANVGGDMRLMLRLHGGMDEYSTRKKKVIHQRNQRYKRQKQEDIHV